MHTLILRPEASVIQSTDRGKIFKPAPGVSCAGLPWDEEVSLTAPPRGGRPPGRGDYNLGRAGEGPNLVIYLSLSVFFR